MNVNVKITVNNLHCLPLEYKIFTSLDVNILKLITAEKPIFQVHEMY